MKVLFVCSGNTCRSPIAAAVAEAWARTTRISVHVRTAGLAHHSGRKVAAHAVTVMQERQVDISREYSKPLKRDDVVWADVIIPLHTSQVEHLLEEYPEHAGKLQQLSEDITDPYLGSIEKMSRVP